MDVAAAEVQLQAAAVLMEATSVAGCLARQRVGIALPAHSEAHTQPPHSFRISAAPNQSKRRPC